MLYYILLKQKISIKKFASAKRCRDATVYKIKNIQFATVFLLYITQLYHMTLPVEFNACKSNPCMHEATCNQKGNNYTCTCNGYYEGTNCASESFIYL